MSTHYLKINLDKTEPRPDYRHRQLCCRPYPDRKVPGYDTLDSQLSLNSNIFATSRSCRYMLHHFRRIRLFLTQKAAQVLVQALIISCLDYCNSLLAGLPASAILPLQLIQNAAAVNELGPVYIQDMVKSYTPAHPLHSESANQLATPSL